MHALEATYATVNASSAFRSPSGFGSGGVCALARVRPAVFFAGESVTPHGVATPHVRPVAGSLRPITVYDQLRARRRALCFLSNAFAISASSLTSMPARPH